MTTTDTHSWQPAPLQSYGAPAPALSLPPAWPQDKLRAACAAAVSPDQMSATEYEAAARVVAGRAPCNLLVYGCGNDSALWAALNDGGRTAFLEDVTHWADTVRAAHPSCCIETRTYSRTAVSRSLAALHAHGDSPAAALGAALTVASSPLTGTDALPAPVAAVAWDVVLVDGPRGYRGDMPGRHVPIAETAMAAASAAAAAATTVAPTGGRRRVDVFVHDIDRPLERAACRAYLTPLGAACTVYERTAHYRFGAAT